MTSLRARWLAGIGVVAAAGIADANNDLSTSYGDTKISAPSLEGTSTSQSSSVGVNQGRASYSIPIVAPPGRGGVEPALELAYGGSQTDGDAGLGWSLTVPRIEVRTSGRGGQPVFGVGVTYLGFSGEDLVDVGDVADLDGDGIVETAFREERDLSFIRYVARSSGGWLVQYPSGLRLTLGTDPANRIVRSGQATWISAWLPESLVDPSGNELRYTWSTAAAIDATSISPTARYLTEIRYGCRGCATATSYQQIVLRWQRRPAARYDFSAGFLVESEHQLASIETASVTAGVASPVRTTTLSYDAASGDSLLTGVAYAAADGSTLPSTTFTYTRGLRATPAVTTLTSTPGVRFKSGVQLLDVDGDGGTDVGDLSSTATAKWYPNTGIGAAAFTSVATSITSPPGQPLVAGGTTSLEDSNRDSAPDVFSLGLARVYPHNGAAGWDTAGIQAVLPGVAWSTNTIRSDINRDGKNDFVDTSVSPWEIYFDNGAYGFTSNTVECTGMTPIVGAALTAASDGVLATDLNRDGLLDIIYITPARTQAHVFYGRGVGCWGWLPEDGHGATPYETLSITSLGSGPTRNAVSVADVTGDGFDDLVMFDSVTARLNAWRFVPGAGWTDAGMGGPFVQPSSATDGCRLGDVDSDGDLDAVCSNGWKVYDWADGPAGLLASAANGLGVTTTIRYTTSARVAANHRAAGHAWDRNVSFALPVVAATEVSDGRGNVLVTEYDYRNPAIEVDELAARAELVGFEYIAANAVPYVEYAPGSRVVDPADPGALTRSWFDLGIDDDLDWYRHGFEVCSETWPAGAVLTSYACGGATGALRRVVSTYTPEDLGGFYTVVLDARDEHVLEGAAAGPQLHTAFAYDAYGNAIEVLAYGRWNGAANDHGADELATVTDYITDEVAWMLRLPKRVQRGGIVLGTIDADDISYFRYDGAADWDVSTVTAGLRTATERWTHDPVAGTATTDVVEEVTYTSHGLPDLVTNAEGVITDHDYDATFGLFEVASTLDPAGLALAAAYVVDPRTGAMTQATAPDGAITRATYDLFGRMTALARPTDTLVSPTLTRSYTNGAPISTIVETRKDGTTDGLISTSLLDGTGRLLCTKQEALATRVDVTVQREYTAAGRVAFEWLPARGNDCDQLMLSPSGRAAPRAHTEHVFDALGRPLRQTHVPTGAAKTWAYRALELLESDEEDSDASSPYVATPTRRVSDGRGRIIAVHEQVDSNGDGVVESLTTRYAWTPLDQLASVIDPLGAEVFTAQYDSRGRRVLATDPDRGAVVTTWDTMNRVDRTEDARGGVVEYDYDAAGRIETIAESVGGVAGPTTVYHYDVAAPGAGATCRNTRGRIGYVDDAAGRTAFCYDTRGRTTRLDRTFNALAVAPQRLLRTYDSLDRMTSLTHPDGSKLTWAFGRDGRASRLMLKGASTVGAVSVPVVSAAAYNASGQPTSLTLGNGAVLTMTYDDRLRPERSIVDVGGTRLQDLTLTLDGVGNVEAITDGAGTSLSATFAYDALYRLRSASGDRYGGHTASYTYDARGNLISKTSTDTTSSVHVGAITYRTDLIHAVDSALGATFTYDAAGNLVDDGAFGYAYNAHGMIDEVTAGGGTVMTNVYDHEQRRVVKDSAAGVDAFYLPEAGLEIRNGVHVKHVSFAGRPVLRLAGTFTTLAGAATAGRFIASDHLGGPTLVMDTTGAVVERWASHPFGEDNPLPATASGHAAQFRMPGDPASVLDRRFQGREIDAEDGTYDFGARRFRADLGRFMSPDSVVPNPGLSQSWNRYSFARNNPLAFIDPSGHSEEPATAPPPPSTVPDNPYAAKHAYSIHEPPQPYLTIDQGGLAPDDGLPIQGVSQPELDMAGSDTLGEARQPSLFSLESIKLKLEHAWPSWSVSHSVELYPSFGKQSSSGTAQQDGWWGTKYKAKCSTSIECAPGFSPPAKGPFSGTWYPTIDRFTVMIGLEVKGADMKAKAGIEAEAGYNPSLMELYGKRLWRAVTCDPTPRVRFSDPPPASRCAGDGTCFEP